MGAQGIGSRSATEQRSLLEIRRMGSEASRCSNASTAAKASSEELDVRLPNNWESVHFVEKAIFASPLPTKPWLEFGRWNPVSLLVLTPVWSYILSGGADHWWFVARDSLHTHYYVAQFCLGNGDARITGGVFGGISSAVQYGLQYPDADWWYARQWSPCTKPRTKCELDKLATVNPVVQKPYSWVSNNCQHFALTLQEGGHPFCV